MAALDAPSSSGRVSKAPVSNQQPVSPAHKASTALAQPQKKGKGTPHSLPHDFLRIPGYAGQGGTLHSPPSSSSSSSSSSYHPPLHESPAGHGGYIDSDAALARLLQDELFMQELAANPEFAYLADPRYHASGGMGAAGGVTGGERSGLSLPAPPRGLMGTLGYPSGPGGGGGQCDDPPNHPGPLGQR